MVRMLPDKTGRFAERPHYELEELDRECERMVLAFLRKRHGEIKFPIATDDLRVLIEEHADSLDAYADLSQYGEDVEGMTAFYPDSKPEVFISGELANDPRRENRLRTTLTHEFGHVHFHQHLWAEKFMAGRLFDRPSRENKAICKRDTILGARQVDWMEWQAGYISGAILMPAGFIRRLVSGYCQQKGLHAGIPMMSDDAREVIRWVMESFMVSEEAARVRLIKLGALTTGTGQPPLFRWISAHSLMCVFF